jgi:hypothetical protein
MRALVAIASPTVSPISVGVVTVFADGARKSAMARSNQTDVPTNKASATAKNQSWRANHERWRGRTTGEAASPVIAVGARGSRERFELCEVEFGV